MSAHPIGLIGVVHLPPMPGDPRYSGEGFAGVMRQALADAEALASGGADGLIIENFGSTPFVKGTAGDRLPPHQVATLALIASECRSRYGLAVGVNCLRNDALAAMGIAAAAELSFIRVNVHTGAYLTDQGIIEGEAASTLRYRAELAAQVAVWADVLVKHAQPLAPLSPEAAVGDCLHRGLADALIVTGEATGAPVSRSFLEKVRLAAGRHPVLIGSGLTPQNAAELAPLAHGAIVGTWLKQGGNVSAPVDPQRVRELKQVLDGLFQPQES